jgi:hypothetical protein
MPTLPPNTSLNIGDRVKIRPKPGKRGWKQGYVIGVVESFLTDPDYLIEYLDGTVVQHHWKQVAPIK